MWLKVMNLLYLKNDLNGVMKKLNEYKDDINEDVTKKYNLEKYEQIIEGSDEDVLTQYETWYDQLAEVVINKNSAIKQIKNVIKHFNEIIEIDKKEEIIEMKKKEEIINDEIKVTLNLLVDKMIDKETIIFDKEEKQRKNEFDEKLKELNGMKYLYDTDDCKLIDELYPNDSLFQQDNEIIELIPSFNKLKKWSNKQKCSLIFDSKIDGDGGNGVLKNKVMNKKNLYFISFDNQNNVFGGYVDTIINKTDYCIKDPNAFTFSLIRNGKMNNIKYNIKNDEQHNAFYLYSKGDDLYNFGHQIFYHFGIIYDIDAHVIGSSNSYCFSISYEYNGDQTPFRDRIGRMNRFSMSRILVIEMS